MVCTLRLRERSAIPPPLPLGHHEAHAGLGEDVVLGDAKAGFTQAREALFKLANSPVSLIPSVQLVTSHGRVDFREEPGQSCRNLAMV